MNNATLVDNTFINEFLPGAPEKAVKVYIYGLSLCSRPTSDDNDLDSICRVLSMSEDEVLNAFSYWQQLGLVQVVNKQPFEVKYLSARESGGSAKLRSKAKYADFNAQIQSIITDRMIKPIEYNEYYNLIENKHFEPEALVMIIKYCTNLKGGNISYPYILSVANSFGEQGIKTSTALEQKLMEQERSSAQIKDILKTLGLNREADLEERNLFLKWTNSYGFTEGVIKEVAKTLNKKGGMNKLDETLSRLYEQKLFTLTDVENYSKEKELLYGAAKKVTSTLGIYYQNLDNVVDVYIKDWIDKGYNPETLEKLALYCFKQDIKSLSLMNEVVQKFYKLGIVTIEALNDYIDGVVKIDGEIKKILDKLGLLRRVNSSDRDFFKTWTEDWLLDSSLIDLAAEKSKNTTSPLRYMNKLLLDLHNRGIKTRPEAEKALANVGNSTAAKSEFSQREYTKEELNALFDSLDDIEV